jgi:hypothetical protein
MRIAWVLAGAMALLSDARAADVGVYIACGGVTCPYPAKKMASAIFKRAGVTVEWLSPKQVRTNSTRILLQIELTHHTPLERAPGALAEAYPFDRCGRGIEVFLDRIRSLTSDASRESELLAYVLVHEITHVIQGLVEHTAEGIMKANWSAADRYAIHRKKLSFSTEDLPRIRQGLAAPWCQSLGSLNAQSLSGIAVHPD